MMNFKNLFRREPSQKEITERAENLIKDQFQRGYDGWGCTPAPAAGFALSLIKEVIEEKATQKLIESALVDMAVGGIKDVVRKQVEKTVKEQISATLKEDLVTEIVEKINNVQIRTDS